MLDFIMLIVANTPFMLSVIMLNFIMLSVANIPFMLSVIMPNVVTLSVIVLSAAHAEVSFFRMSLR